MPFPPAIARALSGAIGRPESRDRADRLHYPNAGHGYDRFGMNPDFVAFGESVTGPLYDRYFRVRSYGHEHIPKTGPGILTSNHSGTVPLDGAMIWTDVFRHTEPPRIPRAVADYFVSTLPVVSTLFARCGVVSGTRGNARALLESGELLMIFPEGTAGIGKPFSERYKLQRWTQGHCEMAIRHGAPVIPIAVIGAEEQMPQVARIPLKGPMPYFPVPATLIPLPVRYHIHYGAPIPLHEEFTPDQADDPAVVRAASERTRDAVQALIDKGLRERKGVFR